MKHRYFTLNNDVKNKGGIFDYILFIGFNMAPSDSYFKKVGEVRSHNSRVRVAYMGISYLL